MIEIAHVTIHWSGTTLRARLDYEGGWTWLTVTPKPMGHTVTVPCTELDEGTGLAFGVLLTDVAVMMADDLRLALPAPAEGDPSLF